MAIPNINIKQLLKGGSKSSDVITKIGQALKNVGIFYISGYDDKNQLAKNLFEVGKMVFDLPTDVKNSINIKNSRVFRGYVQEGDDITSYQADIKEGIYFGPEASDDEEDEYFMIGHNQYPPIEYAPKLPEIVYDYMAKMTSVGNALIKAIAVNLGQKDNFFNEMFAEPFPLLALWRYPSHPENSGDWGVGPHTDYGAITLVLQDDVGGLQAQTRDGEWIEVPSSPG